MNRRKFLAFAAALLPCSFVARMIGEKDLPTTHTPGSNPAYQTVPYGATVFSPTSGFHTEIRELGERYTIEGDRIPPCFRAVIRDCSGTQHVCALESPSFEEGDTDRRRVALDMLYQNVQRVIRQRQFPQDTLIYDTEVTVNGVKLTNPRYPK